MTRVSLRYIDLIIKYMYMRIKHCKIPQVRMKYLDVACLLLFCDV